MIKLAISGCCGKMGSSILRLSQEGRKFKAVALLEKEGHFSSGTTIFGLTVSSNPREIKKADVLIEFTSPESTIEHVGACVQYKKAMVIGTTGLSEAHIKTIKAASKKIPIVFSPNMSVGVNLLFELVCYLAQKIPSEYVPSISEAHHVHKKDAPSGTAKKLAEIIKEEKGDDILAAIKSIREGEIVGDHHVVFEGPFDTITLAHSAKTRDIFAKGALVAAQWIANKKKGLFSMEDVLR